MKKKCVLIFELAILFLFLLANCSNGFVKTNYLNSHVQIVNSDKYFTLESNEILTKLRDDLGCIDNALHEEMIFITHIEILSVKGPNLRGKYSYDIQFGKSGQKIKYKSMDSRYYLEELKEYFGLDENVKDSDLKKGYRWNTNVIGKATRAERGYYIYLESLYAGEDLNKIYSVQTSDKEQNNVVADNSAKYEKIVDGIAKYGKDVVGKIVQTIADWFMTHISDAIQIWANLIQMVSDKTNKKQDLTYSYKYLKADGQNDGNNEEGLGNLDKYTKVGEYENGEEDVKRIKIKADSNENDEDDFTKETEIPVMIGDLYNIAVGHIDFIDVNFLTGSSSQKADGTGLRHAEDSIWTNFRNFAALIIRISIYFASAILLMTLLWHGVRIVGHTFNDPRSRANSKEALNRLKNALLILIGTILFMSVCIFGSQSLYGMISKENTYELPIRVDVEGAYSFSTTPTGYVRYMASTADIEEYAQKLNYSFAYFWLALINLLSIGLMIVRMFLLWLLSIIGPIIAVFYAFGKKGPISLRNWGSLYLSFSLIQLMVTIIYIIILNVLV